MTSWHLIDKTNRQNGKTIISKDTAEVSRPVKSRQNLPLNYEQNFKFYIYSQNSWLDPVDDFRPRWNVKLWHTLDISPFQDDFDLTVNETAQATKKETKSFPNSCSIKTRLILFKAFCPRHEQKKTTYENFY